MPFLGNGVIHNLALGMTLGASFEQRLCFTALTSFEIAERGAKL